jgi:type VI secretion system protein ImpM
MNPNATIQLRNSSSLYFGKISSRGDFVKSTSGTRVIALIDNWIAQGMEMLIEDPRWKTVYDNAGTIDFLLLGMRKRHAICGSLIPSSDSSSRRFPFIAATVFEVDEGLSFLPLSPLVLERHANQQRALIHHAANAPDASEVLATLNDIPLDAEHPHNEIAALYGKFLGDTSIAGLRKALYLDDSPASVRQMILAVGYLLQPVLTNYTIPPQKGLSLPLPRVPARLAVVKAFWLDLISIFLQRAEFELCVFSCIHLGVPRLIVAFNGVTPAIFRALFEEQAAKDYLIDITQSTWVEEHALTEPATLKLSSYLAHEDLPLQRLVDAFRQGFSG